MNDQQSPILTLLLLLGLVFLVSRNQPTPPAPPTTDQIVRLTYVYEKDQGSIPPAISAGLSAVSLSRESVVASAYEDDSTNGLDRVPKQYERAAEASREYGTPCLVAESVERVVRVKLKPTTEQHVMEALGE